MSDPFPEYDEHDAGGLGELVRRGEVTPRTLVEAAIHRIETRDPYLNAVVSHRFEAALAEADAMPSPAATGPPFAGVPFLIKDLTAEEGEPVTYGSVFLRNHRGRVTPEIVTRFRRTGLISLGRTNTPEFGLLPTTEPALHGPTRNPWNLDHSAGGSSGGSAAAVAAGMVPMAHGSDGGGSIRIPASACGVFGLKPTRGRIPTRPAAAADHLSTSFCLSRSVGDSARLLDAVAGHPHGAAYTPPDSPMRFGDAAATDPHRLRIAFTRHTPAGDPVHPWCAAAVTDTAELLESLGHHVEEARPAIDGHVVSEAFLTWWKALPEAAFLLILEAAERRRGGRMLRHTLGDLRTMRVLARLDRHRNGGDAFEPFTWGLVERSMRTTPGDLLLATSRLQDAAYVLGDFLTGYDMWLTPTLGEPTKRIGDIDQTVDFDELEADLNRYAPFTPLANFSGLPAASLPLGRDPTGMPVGSHLVAGHGDETTLLQLAGQLERARPWSGHRPDPVGWRRVSER